MNLHLFPSPGKENIRAIQDASRPYLEGKDDPVVAYLPAASLGDTDQEYREKAFLGLARLEPINTELMTLPEMEAILRNAALVYIPGGNAYLLNHRLHISSLKEYLRKKVMTGLPLVAFDAGTILCGPNILTCNNLNTVETSYFDGLNIAPFNFNCHYPLDENTQVSRDDWLSEYHIFHDNPIVMLVDGAYLRVDGRKTYLIHGEAWILRKGQEKHKLELGIPIAV
jgi:dipeptidase E